MDKKTNKTLIISTILCLLPIVLGLVLYESLPDEIAIHFDSAGRPDNYLPKALAVFGLPVLLAAINVYLHFRLNSDPRRENASASLKAASRWALPLIALVLMPVTLFMAMGSPLPVVMVAKAMAGLVIAVCGNYLPKCRRNFTVGIRLPWTLASDENWRRTHRFAGFVWVTGGLIMTGDAFLSIPYVSLIVIVLLVVLPSVYSYVTYMNQDKKGE